MLGLGRRLIMNLAGKIKTLRTEKNLTQEQLAEKLQVSRSTISSWETGRSYPDLQMIIDICNCFNVSLDFLLREDEKMVRKLNFGKKQKRIFMGVIAILVMLLINTIVSTNSFDANPNRLEVSKVTMIRDMSYNGGDPIRDWNTTVRFAIKSTNPFFRPIEDDMLLFNENGDLSLKANWSFSIFNLFIFPREVMVDQSVLIDEKIASEDITLKLQGDKSSDLIPVQVLDTNK